MATKIKNVRFGWDSELCLFLNDTTRIYLTATRNDEGKSPEDLIVEAINLSVEWSNYKHDTDYKKITTSDLCGIFTSDTGTITTI